MASFTVALKSWVSSTFAPLTHASRHASAGADPITPAAIGAATAAQGSTADGAAQKASNLSDLANAGTARGNLGLGDSATKDLGTTAGTVAAGDDSRIAGALPSSGLDAAAAALVPSGHALGDALAASYSRQYGSSVVIVGESHAAGGTSTRPTGNLVLGDWDVLGWASVLSQGALRYAANFGVGSTSTRDMLTRLAAIAALRPDVVIQFGGTYDTATGGGAQGVTFAEFRANMESWRVACRKMGALPVTFTILPPVQDWQRLVTVEKYNTWLLGWAARTGVLVVDAHALVVDPASGSMLTGYSDDTIHLNGAGAKVVGQALADALTPHLLPHRPSLPTTHAGISANLVAGLFTADTNGDGAADGVAVAHFTPTLVTDAAICGKWQRLTSYDDLQAIAVIDLPAPGSTTWEVGDRLAFCGRIKYDAGGGAKAVSVRLEFDGTPEYECMTPFGAGLTSITNGAWYAEGVVPTGATSAKVMLYHFAGARGASYVQIAQVGIYNLTKMEAG